MHLIWTTDTLTVVNSAKKLEKEALTIYVKELVQDPKCPWKRITRRVKHELFEVLKEKPYRTIQTDQGFIERVMMWAVENEVMIEVHDQREALPALDLSKMYGFRFSQGDLLTKALKRRQSGLIGAPTRYGKSALIYNTVRAMPHTTTVMTAPGKDLVIQMYEAALQWLPDREVKLIGAGSKTRFQSDDVTVCSMDSLDKCSFSKTKLLLVDEPHACVTDSRIPYMRAFSRALRYGYGASLTGRFDGKDPLIEGLLGPVLVNRTYQEAVKEGAICQLDVVLVVVDPADKGQCPANRDAAIRKYLFQNPVVGGITGHICDELIPQDWQTLMFIKNEKQAKYQKDFITRGNPLIAMDKLLKGDERYELTEMMKDNVLKRCLASDIYSQGVTFSDVRVVVNLSGGGPYTNAVQKPGRLAEIRPGTGKVTGIMVDFMFPFDDSRPQSAYNNLARDSNNRYAIYKEKGYNIHWVNTRDELIVKMQELVKKNTAK